jgi:hypothetical protein
MATFSYSGDQSSAPSSHTFEYNPPPKEQEYTTSEVPDIDPASGSAIGTSTTVQTPVPKKYEDYPTIAEMPLKADSAIGTLKMMAGLPFAESDDATKNIIAANMPNAKFRNDRYGNPLVETPDGTYHINRPDKANAQMFSNTVARGAMGIPAAGLAELAAPAAVASIPAVMAAQGAAGAANSAGGNFISNWAGAKQQLNPSQVGMDAAISGLTAGAVKGLFPAPAPEVFAGTPSASQKVFTKSAAEMGIKPNMSTTDINPQDMLLHDPNYTGAAIRVMQTQPNSEAADVIENSLNAHSEQSGARIKADLDTHFGPLSQNDIAVDQGLQQAKKLLGPQLQDVLQKSGPVDSSGVVSQIDALLEKAPPNSPLERALNSTRKMLVEDNGQPFIPGKRSEIPTRGGIYTTSPPQEYKPPTYVSDPTKLNEVKKALDRMVNVGDPEAGINAGSISSSDHAISTVRKSLNNTLFNQVDGYGDLMGKYSNIFDMLDANEMGANMLSGGKNAMRPEQVQAMLNHPDPNVSSAFRTGARASVENKLQSTPNDIAALSRMTTDPQSGLPDFTRQNLELLHGPQAVDAIQQAAQREAGYAGAAKSILAARQAGRGNIGAKMIDQEQLPFFEPDPRTNAFGLALSAGVKAANKVGPALLGRTGPEFSAGIGRILTAPRDQATKALLDASTKGLSPSSVGSQMLLANPAQMQLDRKNAAGGRIGRKSGGRTSSSAKAKADQLIAMVDRIKKEEGEGTKPLLNVDDTTIAKALEIANRGI